MHSIQIKPISVNEAYKGRRFKTPAHKLFNDKVDILLKKMRLPKIKPREPLYIIYRFYTSAAQDYDNNIKCFQDRLMQRLKTDDRYIYGAFIEKIVTKRGEEKIEFEIFKKKTLFLEAIFIESKKIKEKKNE